MNQNGQKVTVPLAFNVGLSEQGDMAQLTFTQAGMQTNVIVPINGLDAIINSLQKTKKQAAGMIINPNKKGFRPVT